MNKILLDTNVVLDVLLDRNPHVAVSAVVWAGVETGKVGGLLSAHALTTIHYLIRKERGNAKATRIVSDILRVFGVAPVDGPILQEALRFHLSDFEDAVTAAAARSAECEFIITRDPRGFRGSPVRALTPEAVLPLLKK
jgi:predicted nucleic acid-binding protein